MRFLVLGATGFIGRHICSALLAAGHEVTGAGRRTESLARAFPGMPTLPIDLAATGENAMRQALTGIDVVVNVAGQLNRALDTVHVEGPQRLYRAAATAGVKRIILISAVSARPDVGTAYARSKLAGERVLLDNGVPWTILRPSMVVAGGSFGGSSVLRGLAGLPLLSPRLPMPDARFSPIHARDLGEVVRIVAETPRFAGATLEPAGAETVTVDALVAAYRQWLSLPPGIAVPVPNAFLAIAVRLSLIALWIGSALAGLLFGTPMALQFAAALGLPQAMVPPLVIATGLLDLAIAALLLTRHSRLAAAVQLAVVAAYTIGLTIALPGLWADPFGALLKNIPILALIAVNGIVSEAR